MGAYIGLLLGIDVGVKRVCKNYLISYIVP